MHQKCGMQTSSTFTSYFLSTSIITIIALHFFQPDWASLPTLNQPWRADVGKLDIAMSQHAGLLFTERAIGCQPACQPFTSPSVLRTAHRHLPSRQKRMQYSSVLRATNEERRSGNDTLQHEEQPATGKMAQTLGNLDALLGIEEEKKAEPAEKPAVDNVRNLI